MRNSRLVSLEYFQRDSGLFCEDCLFFIEPISALESWSQNNVQARNLNISSQTGKKMFFFVLWSIWMCKKQTDLTYFIKYNVSHHFLRWFWWYPKQCNELTHQQKLKLCAYSLLVLLCQLSSLPTVWRWAQKQSVTWSYLPCWSSAPCSALFCEAVPCPASCSIPDPLALNCSH